MTDGPPRQAPEGSTIRLPAQRLLERFSPRMIPAGERVGVYLEKGWSLGIVCRDCRRLVEWTPGELAERFEPDRLISDIAKRLTCAGDEGCGSHSIAVFPHPYDGHWRWPR